MFIKQLIEPEYEDMNYAPGEQIGAYSVSKKEIDVLRNNGIFSIDFLVKMRNYYMNLILI